MAASFFFAGLNRHLAQADDWVHRACDTYPAAHQSRGPGCTRIALAVAPSWQLLELSSKIKRNGPLAQR